MRPRWRAFGILTGLMMALILILVAYMGYMGYFELDKKEVVILHPYDGIIELDVKNDVGSVEIDPWDQTSIEVKGIKKTYFGEEELDKIELVLEEENGILKVSSKRDRDASWVWIDIKISIPFIMNVSRVDVNLGTIDIKNIKGDTEVFNKAGSIRIDGAENITRLDSNLGEVILKNIGTIGIINTDAGTVEIEDTGSIDEINCDSADIRISNTDHVGYINNDGGDIILENCGSVERIRCSAGDIKLDLELITAEGMDVTTDNGDIEVTFPPDIYLEFELYNDNGNTGVDGFLNITYIQQERHTKRGSTGAGGPRVRLETDNGDVDLYGRG